MTTRAELSFIELFPRSQNRGTFPQEFFMNSAKCSPLGNRAIFHLCQMVHMDLYGPLVSHRVPYGPALSCMVLSCPLISIMVLDSLVGFFMVKDSHVWSHIDPYGPVWSKWSSKVIYDYIWSHNKIFFTIKYL